MSLAAHDRRELLRRARGATAALSAAGLLVAVRGARAQADDDGALLERAITLERLSVLAYDSGLSGGLLSPRARRVVAQLRDHERAHVAALVTALTDLGGTPPAEPAGVRELDEIVDGLGDVRTQDDFVRFAIALEQATVAAYLSAQRKLVEARLLQTTASIMAAEGQHLVVLRRLAGLDPVPQAFETGSA